MNISVITLFPDVFKSSLHFSIVKRAVEKNILNINYIDLRDFGIGKHKQIDDSPYGGGAGMVMRVDVIDNAIKAARKGGREAVILLDPKGKVYKQSLAEELSAYDHLIFFCAHYEGIDERARKLFDMEISIGDYVLTGGEYPTLVVIDSIVRLLPGSLQKAEASSEESFSKLPAGRILEYPHYTRPPEYDGQSVPEELLSGNFKKIEEYRSQKAKEVTRERRPDLLKE